MSAAPPTPSTNRPIETGTAPPPPPPPPSAGRISSPATAPHLPAVASQGPSGAFLVELLIYNGHPFKDHWAYWVRSRVSPDLGVMIHATGDVRNGFKFEIKRSHDFRTTQNPPTKRIPLQWVDGQFFDEKAMFNNGQSKVDDVPVCRFEASAHKIRAPGKSLNATSDTASSPTFSTELLASEFVAPVGSAGNVGKKVAQRNCQTWIVDSAEQLVKDRIFGREIANYLSAIQQ